MKRKSLVRLLVLSAFCVLLCTGCKDKTVENALNDVKTASSKTAELKKGAFEFTYAIDDGDENAEKAHQKVTGSFTKNEDNKVDWVKETYVGDDDSPVVEQKQEKSVQYQKLDSGEWLPINENAVGYPAEVEELTNVDWNREDIESVQKEETDNGNTSYTFEFNEEFLKRQKDEELNMMKEELERNKTSEDVCLGLEESVKQYEAISYQAQKIEVVVDKEGVILEYEKSVTIKDENEKPALVATQINNTKLLLK